MQAVPFAEWVDILSQSADEIVDPGRNPAVKLLDLYCNATTVEKGPRILPSHKAENASKTLQGIEPVNETWFRAWMQQWGLTTM